MSPLSLRRGQKKTKSFFIRRAHTRNIRYCWKIVKKKKNICSHMLRDYTCPSVPPSFDQSVSQMLIHFKMSSLWNSGIKLNDWFSDRLTGWLTDSLLFTFLDASSHLYNRLCPSVGRSVGNAFIKNIKFMHFFNREMVLTQKKKHTSTNSFNKSFIHS